MGSWGLHRPLPCIASAEDLMLYALALQDRWPSLPPGYLSTPHAAIDLPPPGHQKLMVEPFIHVARYVGTFMSHARVGSAVHVSEVGQ